MEADTQRQGRNGAISSLTPVEVKKQVVAGMNYFIKAKINDGDEYLFLRIYDRFGEVSLTKVQLGKTDEDRIDYFE